MVAETDSRVAFKTCNQCGHDWPTRDAFLSDPSLDLIGYQANLDDLEGGAFLFNHTCHGTLALPVERFKDLRRGPLVTRRATGTDDCPAFCQHKDELRPCPADCECAYVRDIIRIIQNWPAGLPW